VPVNRRTFLAAGAALSAAAQTADTPIIDTHIHLFDTNRPGGVPWPAKNDAVLYKPALPERYRAIAAPLGIHGAIEVEASPLLEDNQWVLDIAARDKILVGTVGNLEPGKPEFARQLERFHRNPLFLGIRYGNLWGRDFAAESARPEFLAGLKLLAGAGLSLDTANPTPELIATVLRITDKVPALRVIIDHLPQLDPQRYDLRALGQRPQIYVKISEVLRRVDGRIPRDLAFYRPRLDELFAAFGEDRVLYGSDWPNSDQWEPYEVELRLVREYFLAKGRSIAGKYFYRNSQAAYRWNERR
jgi:L-fuconolactonase